MNKLHDIFGPNAERRIREQLNKLEQDWIDAKSCFVCKHCKDISDNRSTCHLCNFTNNFLPDGFTCLLWELKEEYKK